MFGGADTIPHSQNVLCSPPVALTLQVDVSSQASAPDEITQVKMKVALLWVVTQYNVAEIYRRFRGASKHL